MSIYIWLDLETTGLDISNKIIEAAVIITDDSFSTLDEYTTIINPGSITDSSYESAALKLHKKSGLIDKVSSGISIKDAERDIMELIVKYEPRRRRSYIAGNNCHFDRGFLDVYMPSIGNHVCSRMLDVSSVGLLMKALFKDSANFNAHRPHRALDDLRRSIKEIRFYTDNFISPKYF